MYVSENYEQKILPKYVAGCYASILKNLAGDFSNFNHSDPAIKEFVNLFINGLNPSGYYNWNNLEDWNAKIYKTNNTEF